MNKKLLLASVAMLFSSNVFTKDSLEVVTSRNRIFYPDAQKPEKNCCRCHPEASIPMWARPSCRDCKQPFKISGMTVGQKEIAHQRMLLGENIIGSEEPWEADHYRHGIDPKDVVMEDQNNDAQPEMVQTNVQEKSCRRSCRHKTMSPSLDHESQQVHHSHHHHGHHGMPKDQEACMECEKYKRMQEKRPMCGNARMRRHMKNQENVVPMDPVVAEDAIEPETTQIDENQMAQDDTDAQTTIFTPVVDVTDGAADVTEDVLEVPGEMFGCHYNNQN